MGQDHTGKVWIGWIEKGRFQLYANSTLQADVEVGANPWLRYTTCDREGRMWFCTLGGVFYQDEDGFSRFTAADGLPHPSVKAVFHDREERLIQTQGVSAASRKIGKDDSSSAIGNTTP